MRHQVERRAWREPFSLSLSSGTQTKQRCSSSSLCLRPSHETLRTRRLFYYAGRIGTECYRSARRACSLAQVCRLVPVDTFFFWTLLSPTWHRQFNSPLFNGVKATSSRTIFYFKPRNRSPSVATFGGENKSPPCTCGNTACKHRKMSFPLLGRFTCTSSTSQRRQRRRHFWEATRLSRN